MNSTCETQLCKAVFQIVFINLRSCSRPIARRARPSWIKICVIQDQANTPLWICHPVYLSSEKCLLYKLYPGCSHNVMPWHLYVTLKGDCLNNWQPSATRGFLADGSGINIQGVAELKMRIWSKKIIHNFQIAEIESKVLLGMKFLKRYRCLLNIHRFILRFALVNNSYLVATTMEGY